MSKPVLIAQPYTPPARCVEVKPEPPLIDQLVKGIEGLADALNPKGPYANYIKQEHIYSRALELLAIAKARR